MARPHCRDRGGRARLLLLVALLVARVSPSSASLRVPWKRFMKKHWQRAPLHIRARRSGRGQQQPRPLSSGELDGLFETGVTVYGQQHREERPMQNQHDYVVLRRQRGPDGRWWSAKVGGRSRDTMSTRRVRDLFGRGFSLVMNKLNFRKPAVAALAMDLAKRFGHRVSANMYLTPAAKDRQKRQGFEAHFDWMSSFVLQLEGRKEWKLYKPLLRHPYASLKYKPDEESLGPVTQRLVLEPGDLLYIPAGVPHEAATVPSTATTATTAAPSMHLTLGIEMESTLSWEAVMHEALRQTELYSNGSRLAKPFICEHVSSKDLTLGGILHLALHDWAMRNASSDPLSELLRSAPSPRTLNHPWKRRNNNSNGTAEPKMHLGLRTFYRVVDALEKELHDVVIVRSALGMLRDARCHVHVADMVEGFYDIREEHDAIDSCLHDDGAGAVGNGALRRFIGAVRKNESIAIESMAIVGSRGREAHEAWLKVQQRFVLRHVAREQGGLAWSNLDPDVDHKSEL